MKNYKLIIITLLVQLLMFYVFPLCMTDDNAMMMVFVILVVTYILSFILGYFEKSKVKYLYPVFASITFFPSIFIYYNETALVHSLWYLFISSMGVMMGFVLYKLVNS